MPAGRLEGVIPVSHVRSVCHSADGGRLVLVRPDSTGARDHRVRIYRADDLSLVRVIIGVEPCAALSPDGKQLAVMPYPGTRIEFQDLDDGRLLAGWEAGVALGSLEFSKDGLVLFGRNFDGATLAGFGWGRQRGDGPGCGQRDGPRGAEGAPGTTRRHRLHAGQPDARIVIDRRHLAAVAFADLARAGNTA